MNLQQKAIATVVAVLVADQFSKIWVKLSMHYNESIAVFGNWFYIHFIENPGMAFGVELGGIYGKLLLTVFRVLAVGGIAYYLKQQINEKAKTGYVIALALILSGALGNILDSVFYGKLFSSSTPYELASFLPAAGGYGNWLYGNVVDMLYFPVIEGFAPSWVPGIGGDYFVFFRPIFNLADVAISTGVGMILVFQKRYFKTA